MTDGQFVYPKKTARRTGRKNWPLPHLVTEEQPLPIVRKQFSKQLSEIISASTVDNSPEAQFHKAALAVISDIRKTSTAELNFVCYGIGRISISNIARWQLAAWLRAIRQVSPKRFFLHDPQLMPVEKSLLRELGFDLMEIDNCVETSDRQMGLWECDTNPTVFFMPHCPKGLYHNLLWANWSADRLNRFVIIGNSFQGYADQLGQDAVNRKQIPTVLALTALPGVVQESPVLVVEFMNKKERRKMWLGCRSLNDTKIIRFNIAHGFKLPKKAGVIWSGLATEASEKFVE